MSSRSAGRRGMRWNSGKIRYFFYKVSCLKLP
ncbi:Uncharacterised protein [Vibrio cholerae]|nr:Uncharacterised protein [Vibrio cholerae]